jgi:Fe2+ or Zn2+ uptake regulation protein
MPNRTPLVPGQPTKPTPDCADPEIRDLFAILRARGRRITSQRLVILRELRRRRRHATADEIYQAVRRDLPGTSSPTVYATLDLLVELGLARKLDVGLGFSLYDPRTEPHQHTVCRRCGRIDDLDGELNARPLLSAAIAGGFKPEGAELVIHGLCVECVAT